MNGNDLLKAMGCIDEKYVHMAQSEQTKPKHMRRWALAAACLCVMVTGAFAYRFIPHTPGGETAATTKNTGLIQFDPIVIMPGQYYTAPNRSEGLPSQAGVIPKCWFLAEYFPLEEDGSDAAPPSVTVIRDLQALESYCAGMRGSEAANGDYLAACESYMEKYFLDNDLLLVTVWDDSAAGDWEVQTIQLDADGCAVNITAGNSNEGAAQPVKLQILIEVHGGKLLDSLEDVRVNINREENDL